MDALFRSQEWQEGGWHGQSNVQGLRDEEERDKNDADVCITDNPDLSVRLFTDTIFLSRLEGGQEGGRYSYRHVHGLHDDEERNEHDADVCATDYSDLWVRPDAPLSPRNPQSLSPHHPHHPHQSHHSYETNNLHDLHQAHHSLDACFFRSWQEGGRHGQRNVDGLHDNQERNKHDPDFVSPIIQI